MGNKTSKSSESEKIENENNAQNESQIINKTNKKIIENNSEQLTQEKTYSDMNSSSFFKIYWKDGGNEVFITGAFCDWKNHLLMKKNEENNYFEKEIPIINKSKGKIEFKFIIDKQWKFSENYPKIKDRDGNINNYLDDIYIKEHSNDLINNINNNNTNNNINKEENKKSSYGNKYPTELQLNQEAQIMPEVLDMCINLGEYSNQIHKNKKKIKYYKFKHINFTSDYKHIFLPEHSYINHILINKYNFKNYQDVNYIRINCNVKIKSKGLSLIYFSPINVI